MTRGRQSTGCPGLDDALGGGLIPGTLTAVVGATGIGKTQLGVQYAHAGEHDEGRRGVFLDMAARGDQQSHKEYALRMRAWALREANGRNVLPQDSYFDAAVESGDFLRAFSHAGRRVTRRDLEPEAWQDWQAELARGLQTTISFLYGNFVRGVRRVVIDGIEPVERPGESIQIELFEYVYHQILRKDADWVARDLFRQAYRSHADLVSKHFYQQEHVGCLLLLTSAESMLEDLIRRPLGEGDVLANANTLIYMGKMADGGRIRRGLYIAKHRGSSCREDILPFAISDGGIESTEGPRA